MSEKIVERFGQGGVGKGGFAQHGVGEFAHHRQLQHGHDFAALDAEDGGAEDLIGTGVDDGFHKAAGFVDFESARHVVHGHLGDENLFVLRTCFGFGEADAAQLRIDENGVRNKAAFGGGASLFNEIRAEDAEVVVGDVRKRGAARDIAQGENAIEVDVRILAATNVNVHQAIAAGKFREDLYYRISAFTIMMPPLRERREEIPFLLHRFMGHMATLYSRPAVPFSPALIDACHHYPWPGNMRELENFVKRYLVMGDESLALSELQSGPGRKQVSVAVTAEASVTKVPENDPEQARNLKILVRNRKFETEIEEIAKALAETNWNRTAAARLLQVSYRNLLYKIQKYQMKPPLSDSGHRHGGD